MERTQKRTDELGRAYKGSQLQVQIYVNRRQHQLDGTISAALQLRDASFTWVSPLELSAFKELQDLEFLEAVDQYGAALELAEFWPAHGPVWDALARVRAIDVPSGVLLVEGKSYPAEMKCDGCKATPDSRTKIESALARTQAWLGVPGSPSWMGEYYQLANRLAHLYFFRQVVQVPAWLVSVCFVDDPHESTTEEQWHAGLAEAEAALGLGARDIPFYASVLLPARARRELVPDSQGAG